MALPLLLRVRVMGLEEIDRMPPKVREKYLEILRAIPIGRRIEITAEFCDATRELMVAGIRLANPDISDDALRKEVIRRTLPEDLRKRVYGW